MGRVRYGDHPIMNGTIPYGGFPDDPSKKNRSVIKIKNRKPVIKIKQSR